MSKNIFIFVQQNWFLKVFRYCIASFELAVKVSEKPILKKFKLRIAIECRQWTQYKVSFETDVPEVIFYSASFSIMPVCVVKALLQCFFFFLS